MQYTPNPAAAKVARRLETMLDALRPAADADPKLAFHALCLACHDAIDALDGLALPPVSGGSPDADDSDDYEVIDLDGLASPTWPAYPDPLCDGFRWEPDYTGPTPLSILADEAPFDESYASWLDRLDSAADAAGRFTEADMIAAFGTC